MAEEDGIHVLLEKADLQQYCDSFIHLGAKKVSHFVDVDIDMMTTIGLTPLEIKRLNGVFNENENQNKLNTATFTQSSQDAINNLGEASIKHPAPSEIHRKKAKQAGVYVLQKERFILESIF